MKTIKLTDKDAAMLANCLGYAIGSASRAGDDDLRLYYVELADKIVVQLDVQGYVYGDKTKQQVIAQLAEEGIVLP